MTTQAKAYFKTLILGVFLLVTMVHTPNIARMVYGQGDSLPFEIGDISGNGEKTNSNNSSNNSNSTNYDENDGLLNCEMPPCPPGQACIQSCPEVMVQ